MIKRSGRGSNRRLGPRQALVGKELISRTAVWDGDRETAEDFRGVKWGLRGKQAMCNGHRGGRAR